MTLIYEHPKYLKVFFNREKKYVQFSWTNFGITLDALKMAHQIALETLLSHQCFCYIAETSAVVGTLNKPIIDWWTTEWVPHMQQSNIKAIATVVPKTILATYSTIDWQTTDFGGIALKNAKTLHEAELFLESFQ